MSLIQLRKGAFIGLLLVGLAAGLTGCDLIGKAVSNSIGPAHPQRDAAAFLKGNQTSQEVIDAVTQRKPLAPDLVKTLSESRSTDVRYLLASNRHLSPEQIQVFIKDRSEFVRSGMAKNPRLTREQMLELMNGSHTVLIGLASNPSVPEELLHILRYEHEIGLEWFATNPKCPPAWKKEILEGNDESAKYWLKVTEEWAKHPNPESAGWTWGQSDLR